MFRLVFRFLLLLFFFAFIRYVITTVARVFSQTMRSQSSPPPAEQLPKRELGGELKQDPVCGTFVSTTSSVKKTVNGELVHFCSVACRDKFRVA
jgi:YHS domain-containing protein